MLKLFINTILNEVEIGVIADKELLGLKTWKRDRNESEKIIPVLDAMLKDLSIDKNQFEKVYLVNGPGEFTSLRIGHIIAKTIAENLGISLLCCDTFNYIKARTYNDSFSKYYLNAGGDFVYAFDKQDGFEIVRLGKDMLIVDNVWFELSQKQLQKLGISTNHNLLRELSECLVEVENQMQKVDNLSEFEPNYIKEPNIT